MYIKEARITQFGILESQEMLSLPNSLIVVHGVNEAGKSTLLNFFRCMVADIPQRKDNEHYRTIPGIDLGFSGKIRVVPSSVDSAYLEIYKKYGADSRKKSVVTLNDSFGKSIDMSLWRRMLGSAADIAVYKNMFGISLSELVAVTKGDIKDALYGASIAMNVRSPRKVLDLLDTKSNALYRPKGQNQAINKLLVDLARVEEERYACLAVMEQYESLRVRAKALSEEISSLDEDRKCIQERVTAYQKIESSFESYKSAVILLDEVKDLPASSQCTTSLKVEFEQLCREKENIEEQSIGLLKKNKGLNEEIVLLSVDENIVKNAHQIYILLEKKSQYQSMQENLQKIRKNTEVLYENIEDIVMELGDEWDNERIQKIDTSFAVDKEISKREQLLHEHDAGVNHKTQNLEDIQGRCKILERELSWNEEENECVVELPMLEENIEKLQVKYQEYQYKERERASIESALEREVAIICPEWSVEEAKKCSLSVEEIRGFRSLAETHAQYVKKWDNLKERSKRCEIKCSSYIEDLEKNAELLNKYEEGNTTKDLETISSLENLIYVREQIFTARYLSRKVLYCTWISLFIIAIFTGLYFIHTGAVIFSSVIVGFSLLVGLFCAYFVYSIENSIKKHLVSLDMPEVRNISQLENEILICSVCLGLEDVKRRTVQQRKILLLENKEINDYYKFCKKHEATLKELLFKEREEYAILLDSLKDEEAKMDQLQYRWRSHLEALHMPRSLEISPDAFQKFFESMQNITKCIKQSIFVYEDLARIRFVCNDVKRIIEESTLYRSRVHLFTEDNGDYEYFFQEMKKCIKNLQEIAKNRWAKEEEYKKLLCEIEVLEEAIPEIKRKALVVIEWKKWLLEQGYPEDINPEIVREYIKQIRKIKEYNKSLEKLSKEEQETRFFLENFEAKLQKYIIMLPYGRRDSVEYKDSLSRLEYLCLYLKEEEEKYRKRDELLGREQELSKEIGIIQERLGRIAEKIQNIFRITKTSSIEDVRNAFDIFEKYNEKRDRIEQLHQTVKGIVYPRTLQDVEEYFSSFSLEELRDHIQEELRKIELLETRRVILAKECGMLENQITQAEKGGINIHNMNYAMLTTEIEKHVKEWMQMRVAKEIIMRAKRHLEEHKQPFVMEIASLFMNEITDGFWNRILRSTENDIILSNTKGARSNPELLSRGTQEQAYCALRLAGACNHATITKESLPLLLDDVTVNFDSQRAQKMAKLLLSLASGSLPNIPQHQIFLFTCHDSVVNMFKNTIPEAKFFSLNSGVLSVSESFV
ncbi:MAG: AAA family ATPase [Desulfovibrionaceae bacterium]